MGGGGDGRGGECSGSGSDPWPLVPAGEEGEGGECCQAGGV